MGASSTLVHWKFKQSTSPGMYASPLSITCKTLRAEDNMDWSSQHNYPNPDYLSSSRKRLAPQLIYKGGILKFVGQKDGGRPAQQFLQNAAILAGSQTSKIKPGVVDL